MQTVCYVFLWFLIMPQERKHILLLPGPFFGHYIPFLEFAKKAVLFHGVTIAVVKSKVADIEKRNLVPPYPITLTIIPDASTFNFDNEFSEVPQLIQLVREAAPAYLKYIETLSFAGSASHDSSLTTVDAAFVDWTLAPIFKTLLARNIPIYILSTFAPTQTMNNLRVDANTPTIPDESFVSGINLPSGTCIESFKASQAAFNKNELLKCRGVLIGTIPEMDPNYLKRPNHDQMLPIPVHFIGPFLPTGKPETTPVSKWLDTKADKSIIYVSFGSIGMVSPEQLIQIGEALLRLGRPFIWALREPQRIHLPNKFRTSSMESIDVSAPYLILPWVSQREILSHPATAVFVSHCGWNSACEAAFYGVPVVAWPLFGDQASITEMLEQLRMGSRVGPTGLNSKTVIKAEDIAKAIEKVAGWEKHPEMDYGRSAKEMSRKMQDAVGTDGRSINALKQVMEEV